MLFGGCNFFSAFAWSLSRAASSSELRAWSLANQSELACAFLPTDDGVFPRTLNFLESRERLPLSRYSAYIRRQPNPRHLLRQLRSIAQGHRSSTVCASSLLQCSLAVANDAAGSQYPSSTESQESATRWRSLCPRSPRFATTDSHGILLASTNFISRSALESSLMSEE